MAHRAPQATSRHNQLIEKFFQWGWTEEIFERWADRQQTSGSLHHADDDLDVVTQRS